MSYRRLVALVLVVALMVITGSLLQGCGGSGVVRERPPWVDGDCLRTVQCDDCLLCATDSYSLGKDEGVDMVRMGAATAARIELARSFETHVSDLVKIYRDNLGAPELDTPQTERLLTQVGRLLTDMNLPGSHIAAYYDAEYEGTYYAMAVFSVDDLDELLRHVKDVSDEVRESVRSRAAEAFDELGRLLQEEGL